MLGIVINIISTLVQAQLPIVVWHGLAQDCCSGETKLITDGLKAAFPNTYIKSIKIGLTDQLDLLASSFGNANEQVAKVCDSLKRDERLRGGFNAIGISQGGLMMRAYVERCNEPKVHNLITLGSPHQGVRSFPGCFNATSRISAAVLPDVIKSRLPQSLKDGDTVSCVSVNELFDEATSKAFLQEHILPAQYYKNPEDMESYYKNNKFLAEINNERAQKNPTYRSNLSSLNKFIMVAFENDRTVVPAISTLFGWSVEGGSNQTMEETEGYKGDWIGLKTLKERGDIVRITIPGVEHTEFPPNFTKDYLVQWLNEPKPANTSLSNYSEKLIGFSYTLYIIAILLL